MTEITGPIGRIYSMEEAAQVLGISTRTLRGHIRHGEISYISVGCGVKHQRRMFHASDIEAFVARRRRTECPSIDSTARMSIPTISSTEVFDFLAQRAARRGARPSGSKPPSEKRRGKR